MVGHGDIHAREIYIRINIFFKPAEKRRGKNMAIKNLFYIRKLRIKMDNVLLLALRDLLSKSINLIVKFFYRSIEIRFISKNNACVDKKRYEKKSGCEH